MASLATPPEQDAKVQRIFLALHRGATERELLERHAAPDQGHHAIQLEIDRSRYLDARLAEPGPGFATMVELLTGLVQRLAGAVAELGQAGNGIWRQAAE